MFEYNLTTETEFQQLNQENQRLAYENEQLKREIEQLNDNIQTLLQYNSKLLGIIEEINNSKKMNNDQDQIHQNYQNQIYNLRERIQQYQQNEIKYKQEIKRLKNQNTGQKDKKNDKQAGSTEVIKLVQECYKNNQAMQRKFEQRFDNLFSQIDTLRSNSKQINDEFQSTLQQRRLKIQEIFDQFQKKDEIVDLMGQKVKILQDYYVSKKQQLIQKMVQTQQSISLDSRDGKKGGATKEEIEQFNRKIQEKNKVIKIYEELIDKLRKKISEKYFS